jgi:rSAM/selenodomain-associated transferase 1
MARGTAPPTRRARFAHRLIIMAKSPRRGYVKRRLAREIGEGAAVSFYRSCLARSVQRLARDPRWTTLLALAPDVDAVSSLPVLRGVSRLPQGRGDLGRRMQRLFDRLPPGPVIIIGSDIPAIAPERIAEAFALLGRHDAVLGRALDGGFWLIGLKRSPRVLASFAHVRWSGPHALDDTLANLTGARVAFTATLCDVDTREDYLSLCASAARLVSGRARYPK